jgi:hypothetical protein
MWPFYLQLIDQDFSKHDLIDVLWFDVDGDLSPDPLYPSLLSGGEYNDATASGGVLRITFELVEGCD